MVSYQRHCPSCLQVSNPVLVFCHGLYDVAGQSKLSPVQSPCAYKNNNNSNNNNNNNDNDKKNRNIFASNDQLICQVDSLRLNINERMEWGENYQKALATKTSSGFIHISLLAVADPVHMAHDARFSILFTTIDHQEH